MPEIDDESTELLDISINNSEVTIITAEGIIKEAGDNLTKQADALETICLMLANLKNPIKSSLYIKDLSMERSPSAIGRPSTRFKRRDA